MVILSNDLTFVSKVERLSLFIMPREHECVRAVGFDLQVMSAIWSLIVVKRT
jgi:hypothetical protein